MSTPKPPTLRALTRELRDLHEAWSHPDAGGEYVSLVLDYDGPGPDRRWQLTVPPLIEDGLRRIGREYIPGDGAPFDAAAAARRLLAAWRDAQAASSP